MIFWVLDPCQSIIGLVWVWSMPTYWHMLNALYKIKVYCKPQAWFSYLPYCTASEHFMLIHNNKEIKEVRDDKRQETKWIGILITRDGHALSHSAKPTCNFVADASKGFCNKEGRERERVKLLTILFHLPLVLLHKTMCKQKTFSTLSRVLFWLVIQLNASKGSLFLLCMIAQ